MKLSEDFYKEETRLNYTVSTEMKQVWGTSIEIAMKLIEVCQRNNLKCWMEGGTLLGAVRHKGFIPWDDDIDFVMLRKDYDKLLKIAENEFTYPYFFQTAYSDKEYYAGHAQIRDVRTSAMAESEINKKFCRGIELDLFVLDGYIENPIIRFFHRTTITIIKKTFRGYISYIKENKTFSKKLIAILSKGLYSIIPYRKAFAFYEWLFRIVDEDKHERVAALAYKYKRKRICKRSSFDSTIWLPFEEVMMPAPVDTNDVLTNYFGKDYMTPLQLPADHGHRYLDATMPYKEASKMLIKHPEKYKERLRKLYNL